MNPPINFLPWRQQRRTAFLRFWLLMFVAPLLDAPRDKCAHFREINGIAAAFQHLQKNYNPIASSFL